MTEAQLSFSDKIDDLVSSLRTARNLVQSARQLLEALDDTCDASHFRQLNTSLSGTKDVTRSLLEIHNSSWTAHARAVSASALMAQTRIAFVDANRGPHSAGNDAATAFLKDSTRLVNAYLVESARFFALEREFNDVSSAIHDLPARRAIVIKEEEMCGDEFLLDNVGE